MSSNALMRIHDHSGGGVGAAGAATPVIKCVAAVGGGTYGYRHSGVVTAPRRLDGTSPCRADVGRQVVFVGDQLPAAPH